jgi:hypothetical protein
MCLRNISYNKKLGRAVFAMFTNAQIFKLMLKEP